ncbi:MAG: hypothetical protein KF830_12830 [Planctomycetes bacterium]|nr:hypothetical protein [Planctomycetota bacterium]
MDLPDPVVLLKGTLPPIAAALLLVGLGGARLLPLAVAVGLGTAFGLLKEWPALPHQLWAAPDGRQWLLWGLFAATVVALVERFGGLRGRAAAGVGAAAAAAAVYLLLMKQAARWDMLQVLQHVGVGGLAAALSVLACRTTLGRAPANVAPAAVFTLLLSADAVLLTLGRSGLLAQMCGAVAAALGAAAGTSLWRRDVRLVAADGAWLGAAHGLFVLAGVHLASLAWPAAWCALAAPLPLLLLGRGLAARPVAWTVAAVLALLPGLAAAFWLASGG